MNYQWYPGHMTKAKRMMEENIKLIDIVIEVLDARIPFSSRNPDIDTLGKNKSRLILLNKSDLADEEDCWYRSEIRDDGEENTEIYKEIYPVSGEIFHEQEENGPIRLEVWKYLNYDEDGQIYVERTRCAGILTEGGKKDE